MLRINVPDNGKFVNSWRNLQVLGEIESNSRVSQRTIASSLGIALGLTNAILRKLMHKGWVTTRALPANRLAYYLTPKGFAEKSRLVMEHVKNTTSFFYNVRGIISQKIQELMKEQNIKTVAIFGTDVLAETAYLSVKELELELTGIYDWNTPKKRWLGMEIKIPDGPITADIVIVTYLDSMDDWPEICPGCNSILIEMKELLASELKALSMMM